MSAVMFILGVLVVVVGVGLSIALHELGHLIPAKRFGVKVPQYMVGFGPTLWSRQVGETEIGIKAIPLGGYVRMIGMFPPAPGQDGSTLRRSSTGRFSQLADQARADSMDEVKPGDEDRVFYKLSTPKKVITMLGGPLTNLVIGVVLLAGVMCLYGVPTTSLTLSSIGSCVPTTAPTATTPNPQCVQGDPVSPATTAGLRVGDRITTVAGQPATTWSQVQERIKDSGGSPLALTVVRDGGEVMVEVTPAKLARTTFTDDGKVRLGQDGKPVLKEVGFLGITPAQELQRQPLTAVPAVVGQQLSGMAGVIARLPQRMADVAQAAFGGQERDPNGPISVVGVGRIGGEVASAQVVGGTGAKLVTLVQLIAGLNLALFLFNMIPLLPLDGGHVIGALWEGLKRRLAKLRGRPDPGYVDVAKGLPIAYTVSILLIGMSALLIYADIVRPVNLFG